MDQMQRDVEIDELGELEPALEEIERRDRVNERLPPPTIDPIALEELLKNLWR